MVNRSLTALVLQASAESYSGNNEVRHFGTNPMPLFYFSALAIIGYVFLKALAIFRFSIRNCLEEMQMATRLAVKFLVGAALLFSVHAANAQVGQVATKLPTQVVAEFKASPNQLLSQYPNGGPDLEKQVGDLVYSDKAALEIILQLAKTANEDQRRAIARGLAVAAKAYAESSGEPGFATDIQRAVVQSGLPEFAKNYAEAAGDTGTGSNGGGGGGGGGPTVAGAPTGGSSASGNNGGSNPLANRSTGLTGATALGAASFSPASEF